MKVNSLPWYDIIIMLVGAAAFFYYSVTYDAFVLEVKSASSMTSTYSIIGLIGILAVVELCRRCVGLPILCVAGALVIYTFSAGIPFDRFIYTIFYSVNGILATPVNVCAKFIVVFVISARSWSARASRTSSSTLQTAWRAPLPAARPRWPSSPPPLEGMASGSSVAKPWAPAPSPSP